MKKKVVSLLLVLAMLLGMVPAGLPVMAEEPSAGGEGSEEAVTTESEPSTVWELSTEDEPETSTEGESGGTVKLDSGLCYEIVDDHVAITGYHSEKIPDELVIPETIEGLPVTEIWSEAFWNCTTLQSIFIPSTVSSIGHSVFAYCHNLSRIEVDSSNAWYTGEDSALFSKDKSLLLAVAEAPFSWYSFSQDVTEIGAGTFLGNNKISSIIVPDGVTRIGERAFAYCKQLSEVSLSNSLDYVGEFVFQGCDSLESVVVPEGLTEIPANMFWDCKNLVNVSIPQSVTVINSGAFYGCTALDTIYYAGSEQDWIDVELRDYYNIEGRNIVYGEQSSTNEWNGFYYKVVDDHAVITGYNAYDWLGEFVIPSEIEGYPVTEIADYAFRESGWAMDSVTVPASVVTIGEGAFDGCYNLYTFRVDENNQYYSTDDHGVLFNKNKTVLIRATEGGNGTYRIPESVREIKAHAFYDTRWSGIVVPEGVERLEETVFESCWSLQYIGLPQSLTYIGENAFNGCNELDTIYYAGGEAEWLNVTVDDYYNIEGCEIVYRSTFGEVGNLTYVIRNNQVAIAGYYTIDEVVGELVLPSEIEGYPVTEVLSNAFNGDGWAIEYLIIPASVISIEGNALRQCINLQGFRVDENNQYYSTDDHGVLFNKNKTVLIRATRGDNGTYNIPASVREIAAYAFDNTWWRFVVVPEGVERLSKYAFRGCDNLRAISLPQSLVHIEDYAFESCYNFQTIYYAGSEEEWLNVTVDDYYNIEGREIVYHASGDIFGETDGLLYRIEGNHVVITGFDANDEWRDELVIPEEIEGYPVTEIANNTFETDGWAFDYLVLSKNIAELGESAFPGCYNLKGFVVDEDNPYYTNDEQGSLLNKEKTTLISVAEAGGNTYRVPEGVREIKPYAFSDNEWTTIVIPEGVERLEAYTFVFCNSLRSIVLPRSLTYIEDYAFGECYNLQTVYYAGSQEEWQQVDVYDYVIDDCEIEYGMTPNTENDFVYWVVDDEAVIIGYLGDADRIMVPAELGSAPVIEIGESAFRNCDMSWVGLPEGVKRIAESAFAGCKSHLHVILPQSLEVIGTDAFAECWCTLCYAGSEDQWLNVSIEDPNVDDCEILYGAALDQEGYLYSVADGTATIIAYMGTATELTIPSAFGGSPVTQIGEQAFYCCDIVSVVVPGTVKYIGGYAFANCSELERVTLQNGIEEICERAFADCTSLAEITIPGSVKTIGEYAFLYCVEFAEVTISEGVENIGEYAFAACYKLTRIEIPASVKKLVPNALNCRSLTAIKVHPDNPYYSSDDRGVLFNKDKSLLIRAPEQLGSTGETYVIPESVIAIGEYAFCCYLKTVVIPASVIDIGYLAFSDNVMERIDVNPGNKFYSSDEYGVLFDKEQTTLIQAPGTGLIGMVYKVPASVTTIEDSAFYYNSGLIGVEFPAGLRSIGEHAFQGCGGIRSVVIPEGITTIVGSSFSICKNLESVMIPRSVSHIGDWAFDYCPNLETVYYAGSPAEWGNITYGEYESSGLQQCRIVYNASVDTAGFRYEVMDRNVVITGYIGGGAVLEIPVAIEGLPVIGIGENAFRGNENLTQINLPEGIERIEAGAFSDCGCLAKILLPKSLSYIGENAFEECYALESIYYRGSEAKWIDVTIDDYYNIEGRMIYYHANPDENGFIYEIVSDHVLITAYFGQEEHLEIPAKIEGYPVTDIEHAVFANNHNLKTVIVPEDVAFIGHSAFMGCTALKEITLPVILERMSDDLFLGCTALNRVMMPDWVVRIGSGTFQNCENLSRIDIPNSVTSIGEYAFSGCTSLSEVVLPQGIYAIWDWTFENCTSLRSIVIPDGVETISMGAFYNSGLEEITIPAGVHYLDRWAFGLCESLTKIVFLGDAPEFHSMALGGVTANAYYPAENSSWNDGTMQDYQGDITWVAGVPGVTLGGSVISYLDDMAPVDLQLLNGNGQVLKTVIVTGNDATYTMADVAPGTYTLRVSKANHVTRNYEIVVGDVDVTQNVTVLPYGDITKDGKVTATDYSRLLAHVKKTSSIQDEYMLLCADVTGDGKITATDYSRLLAHVKKVSLLW